jgi:ectoine hydroxylase-related dioxygenase (phytanoyl-CoA dioxygenase family)
METEMLSQAQREQFDRDGYLRFDPGVSDAVLDGVLKDLEPRYLREGDAPQLDNGVLYSPGAKPRIRDAWRISENVRGIALAPKVLAVLTELYGRKPCCFQTLNFPVSTEQAPHSDSMHFSPDQPNYMCGVWVALEDIDMDNGPLIYYPGSHRLPFLDYDDIGFQAQEGEYSQHVNFVRDRNSQYESYVANLIEQHGFKPEYGTINRGEALVWAANLLHGGSPLRDRSRSRQSQVSHYLFEGSTGYYTAMVSGPDRRVWNEVGWVT